MYFIVYYVFLFPTIFQGEQRLSNGTDVHFILVMLVHMVN